MKKKLLVILAIILIFTIYLGFVSSEKNVALIPLDSRPCNTQYPEMLSTMSNINLEIPYKYLDNYLIPADTDNLWSWLEENSSEFDQIIINTTELITGSLIASRHPDSYANIEAKMAKLKKFCLANKDQEVIVISILPRLLPSQFSKLWPYQEELTSYAKSLDENSLKGQPLPKPPSSVPQDILKQYLNIYESSQLMVEEIIALTNQGLIDHYLIGQDDAEEFGLSNRIVREIKPQLNEKIQFVHGADELTMLALVKTNMPIENQNIKIVYSNENTKGYFYPFEAAPLDDVLQTKIDYLQITNDKNSTNLEIIHNDPEKSLAVAKALQKPHENNYLGIMDVSYTNRGDINLLEPLLNNNNSISGYAGWNTASNTIGTELAHFIVLENFDENFKFKSKKAKIQALEAYIDFKYLRIAEDLIYQGILREELNEALLEEELDPYHLAGDQKKAEKMLKKLFEPYQEKLQNSFLGEHQVGELKFTVENITSEINLPWARTFEAKVDVQVDISL